MSAYAQQRQNTFNSYLLIFFFIGLVSSLFLVFGWYFDNLFLPVIGFFLALGQSILAFFFGDKLALSVARAKQIQYQDNPQLFEMVENLSKIAGIPIPKVFISPDPSANAFATGRDPKNASIVFNQGILDLLNKNELEGVIAHELSHVKNRDILFMTIVMVLASFISFVADIGLRLQLYGSSDSDRKNNSPILLIFYIILIIAAPFLSLVIQLAVSRQREFFADATAVTLTRYPEGLIGALQKLYENPVPTQHYSTAMNHFYISPPKQKFGESMKKLFSTHPSIEDRVSALKKM